MSEYTDYMIYQTTAVGLEALRTEVAALAPPGTAIFPLPAEGDEAAAAARLTGAPVWVALMSSATPASIAKAPGTKLVSIFVLEDFASWRLEAHCDGQRPLTLYFGGADGYADGWFTANQPDFAGLTSALTTEQITRLEACFNLPAASLAPLLAYDRVWDFLAAIDAPSMQMADQSLMLDDFPADLPIAFAWEIWPETYD